MQGINQILKSTSSSLLSTGRSRFNNRTGKSITELRNQLIIGDPTKRYITLPTRKNNFAAQIMEMMMVLSGNPDLVHLSKVLPRAKDYSDDNGKTWRGNYGTRLRGNRKGYKQCESYQFVKFKRDILQEVIQLLSQDSTSRQGFISIGDGQVDQGIETKDVPCTMTLVFSTDSDGKLDLTTFMRSNDLIFGLTGVNYFIFTCLQELVANILDLDLGCYIHHAVSLHVYEDKFKTLTNISNDESEINDISLPMGVFSSFTNLEDFDNFAAEFFDSYDNPEESLTDFYSRMISFERGSIVKETQGVLTMMVTIVKAFVNGYNPEELDQLLEGFSELKLLVERDIFLAKKLI